eukprot:8226713-Prorocentrum_lima.AAC.1
MKNFLHLHGTTLKPDTKSESGNPKRKAKGIRGMNMEAHQQGTSVEPVGSTFTKEVGSTRKDQ